MGKITQCIIALPGMVLRSSSPTVTIETKPFNGHFCGLLNFSMMIQSMKCRS